ncbi:MAG: hypothetical protein AAFV95_16155 [Bacteroidota bacterium]
MKGIDKELEELHEQKQLKEKIEIHIQTVREKLEQREVEKEHLLDKLDHSHDRMEKLEKLPLRNLFGKVLGHRKERCERERQNYLMYFLRLREIKERIKVKKYEIEVLEEKLLGLKGIEERFEKLIRDKKNQLKFKNKELAKEIIEIEGEIRWRASQQREIKEAMLAGQKAIKDLEEIKERLKVIDSWPLNALPSEPMTLLYKQKKYVKSLQSHVRSVNGSLDDFIDELQDVSKHYQLDYEQFIRNISRFLENFYDGLVSDWILGKEMRMSLNMVESTKHKVDRIQDMLQNDLDTAKTSEMETRRKLEVVLVENKLP